MRCFRFDTLNFAAMCGIASLVALFWTTTLTSMLLVLAAAIALSWQAWLGTGSIITDETGIERIRWGFRRRLEWADVIRVQYGRAGRVVLRGPAGRISFTDQLPDYGQLTRVIRQHVPPAATGSRRTPFTIRRSLHAYFPFLCAVSAAILCLAPSQEIVQIVFFSSVFASMPLLPLNQRGERFVLSVKFGDERIEVRKFWGNGYSVPVKDLHHVALHTCEYKGIRHRRLELHLGHNILRINGWQFATGRMEVAEALIRCYGRNSRWAHLPEVQEYVSLFGQVTSSAGPAYDDRGDEIPAASTAGAKPQRWKRRGGRLSSRARIQE